MRKSNRAARGVPDQGWTEIAYESWLLGFDACAVITLRGLRLMGGGSAARKEAQLMVTEKLESCTELTQDFLSGRLGSTPRVVIGRTLAHYRAGVGANRRRLSRGSRR